MSRYRHLSSPQKAKVQAKLAALGAQTGCSWDYHVFDRQGQEEITPLLEMMVEGRFSRPIELPRRNSVSRVRPVRSATSRERDPSRSWSRR
jgi:hypothetical protein